MSGGTFDYIQFRITDAIEEIERRVKDNGKTVQQHWDELDEEGRRNLYDYERPWDLLTKPYWVDQEAEIRADRETGFQRDFDKLTKKQKEKWNDFRQNEIKKLIEEHNKSCFGYGYRQETIDKINEMIPVIKKAQIYLNRIDWLFAGDDGEDSFLKRTEEELAEEGLQ